MGPKLRRGSAPYGGLIIQGVSEAQPRSEAVPATDQGVATDPSRTGAGENQRARKPAGAGVRQGRAEIAGLVVPHQRRQASSKRSPRFRVKCWDTRQSS